MLKSILRNSIVPVFSVAGMLAMTMSVKAQLLVYDGFNYAPGNGSLTNASGLSYVDNVNSGGDSFGWAQRFTQTQAGGNATNLATGMGYTDFFGNQLVTDPGSALIGNNGSVSANSLVFRTFQIGTLVSGTTNTPGAVYSGLASGTYWISFLSSWVGPTNGAGSPTAYSRLGSISFSKGAQALGNSVNGQFSTGRPNTNGTAGIFNNPDSWSLWNSNTPANFISAPGTYLGGTNFILFKLVIDGTTAPDQIYEWINLTNLALEPDIASATLSTNANLTGLNELRVETDGSTTLVPTIMQFDEFRLGTSFNSVTPIPEPSTMALAAAGGLALLTLRRKRR